MENQTACAVMSASETVSDFKKSFICKSNILECCAGDTCDNVVEFGNTKHENS